MFCIIRNKDKIIGIMMNRDIEKETRWEVEDFDKLDTSKGMVLYSAEELKGYDGFTKLYGYQLVYDREGNAVEVLDSEGRKIDPTNLQVLDVYNYPELQEFFNK